MKLYDLKINHLTNPVGFVTERTVFSWKTDFPFEWAQVICASDGEFRSVLARGVVTNPEGRLGTELELELKPRTRYYWKVTAGTPEGERCESEVQFFETGKMGEPWQAQWIGCGPQEGDPAPASSASVPAEANSASAGRHPIFEKTIPLRGTVARARLYICGLGLYEAYIGGKKVGNEYLTPLCTAYDHWIQYETYDVKELLGSAPQAGFGAPGPTDGAAVCDFPAAKPENSAGTGFAPVLSVILGNGWYKGRFGFADKDGRGHYGDSFKLLAELHIEYEDGTEQVIGTDDRWTVRGSSIVFSNIYDGEKRDDTLPETPARTAVLCDAPEGQLTERRSLPVTVRQELHPAQLIITSKGEQVLDLGQEITGIFRLHVTEKRGTVIHIQTGEILQQGCFYNENLRSAKSEYWYTSDGTERDIEPHFTFYGYRYVKIEGVSDLKKEDLTGLALWSGIEETGTLETGNELVNRLISNVRWGMRDNFVDVPTDCPQRDERMGWTGDAQVFSPTAMYLADCFAFYSKYLYDMNCEQGSRDGMVPDVIPAFGHTGTAAVWGDASCIIPWNMYVFSGDKNILADRYEGMKAWVDFMRREEGENHGWRKHFHYGDWLALDHPNMHAEQVFGATDTEFIAAVYYAASARIVAKTAAVLGKTADEAEYDALSEREFADIRREYYSATGRCCIKTQTALILSLKYDLTCDRELTIAQLRKLFEDCQGKLRTGFVGTPLLCNVLSENGMSDIAVKLLLNEEFPGWLREVKLGATTVWERWNSLLDDGTISGTSMNSMNHYAYGSILEWMFRWLAGLNFTEAAPGCTSVRIAPVLSRELGHVSASCDTAAGLYKVSWEIKAGSAAGAPADNAGVTETVTVKVQIPYGCTAQLVLPGDPAQRVLELQGGLYEYSYEVDAAAAV